MEPSVLSRSRMMGKKTVNSRRIMAAVMVIVMLAALTGCVGKEDTQTRKKNKVVEIPMILTVDSSTGNKNEEEVVERFNRAYKGKYHIDVDWVMETEEEYRKNLKRMNVTDELPAIITDLRMLPSFYQMMIKKGRIEDLTPYINEDQEWKDMIEPSVMESVREEDGKIYLGPVSTAAFACSGVFWNRELFEQAGISTILVAGSSGAFFHIADTIIQMDNYHALDITKKVKAMCKDFPVTASDASPFHLPQAKRIMTAPPVKRDAYKELKLKTHSKDSFSIGKETVDLRYIEQLADQEQTAALGELLKYAREHLIDNKKTVSQIVEALETKLETQGLGSVCSSSYTPCGLARPRKQEIYSCFNRYRR